jgi:hypothetical protein
MGTQIFFIKMLPEFNKVVEAKQSVPQCCGGASSLLTICFLVVHVLSTNSQDIHNATSIFIGANVEMHAAGALQNQGFVRNNGTLSVHGNFQNSGIYQGLGTVELSGSSLQQIFTNKQAIDHLIVNSAGVSVVDKLIINQSLTLSNGKVLVGSDDTLFVNSHAVIYGGSSNSFIDGPLTISGTGYRYLPVGKGSTFLPLEFTDVKGITPAFEISVRENLPALTPTGVISVAPYYFIKKDLTGFFEKSSITLSLQNYSPEDQVVVLHGRDLDSPMEIASGEILHDNSWDQYKLSATSELSGNVFGIAKYEAPPHVENKFYVSTTITPNASNPENRFVKIFGTELQEDDFVFEVFDRWGKDVFSSHSLEQMTREGWNGQNRNGDQLPTGVYPYVVKGMSKAGKGFLSKGAITIVK